MSLVSLVGPRPNLFDLDSGGTHIRLELKQPILTNVDLEKIRRIEDNSGGRLPQLLAVDLLSGQRRRGRHGPRHRPHLPGGEDAVRAGHNIVVLSDRQMDFDNIAVPSLLAVAAVHHHLIRGGHRTEAGW